jgi:hypothetical protein
MQLVAIVVTASLEAFKPLVAVSIQVTSSLAKTLAVSMLPLFKTVDFIDGTTITKSAEVANLFSLVALSHVETVVLCKVPPSYQFPAKTKLEKDKAITQKFYS